MDCAPWSTKPPRPKPGGALAGESRPFRSAVYAAAGGWPRWRCAHDHLAVLHVMFGANGMVVYRSKRAEYQRLQFEIDRVQKENDQYTQQIKALQTTQGDREGSPRTAALHAPGRLSIGSQSAKAGHQLSPQVNNPDDLLATSFAYGW